MTGGVAVRMDLSWGNVEYIGTNEFKLFLQRHLERNSIFTCSNEHDYQSRATGEIYEENGLVKGRGRHETGNEETVSRFVFFFAFKTKKKRKNLKVCENEKRGDRSFYLTKPKKPFLDFRVLKKKPK